LNFFALLVSERRKVAVLFATLTGARESANPAALLDDAYSRFRAAVEAAGGTVDKFVGETVMAIFGAPVAHGDDPARAAEAAGLLRQAAAAVAETHRAPLVFRAGLAAGEVIWGRVAGDRPTAIGDTVNVAHRLAEAAPAGGILVAAAVERTARGRFTPVPPQHLRGRAEPVEAFLLEETPTGASEAPRIGGVAVPLVGRDAELSTLSALLDSGGAMLVSGVAGVGKSRLLAELRREARRRGGVWVAFGRAADGTRIPLAPFAAILRGELLATGHDHASAAVNAALEGLGGPGSLERENQAHLIAISLGFAIPGSRAGRMEPSRAAKEARGAWEAWFRSVARGRRTLVCVEDLHAADEESAALLEHLASRLGRDFALVATTRVHDSPRPAGFEHLRLGDLPEAAVHRIAEAVFRAPLGDDVATLLREKAGGHPLYVGELARFLLETGAAAGSPVHLARPDVALPAGLGGLLVARLDRLSPDAKEVVKAASVLGRVFWKRLLAVATGSDPAAGLVEALAQDVVVPQPASLLPGDEEYLFQHALLRDAAYGLLTKRDRASLHGRAADALLEHDPGRRVRAMAAGHRLAEGDAEEAARLWLDAASEAQAGASAAEALEWARRSGGAVPSARAALVESNCLRALGRFPDALEAARRSGAAAKTDDERFLARLEEARAEAQQGKWPLAIEIAAEVAAAAPPARRVEALVERARILPAMGRAAEAAADVAAGRALLDAIPDPAPHRAALHEVAGRIAYFAGRPQDAIPEIEQALALYRARGENRSVAQCVNNLGIMRFVRGDLDSAAEAYREALALAAEMGDRYGMQVTQTNIGTVHMLLGDPSRASDAFRSGLRLARDIGDLDGIATNLTNLGATLHELGELEEALRLHQESVDAYRKTGNRHGEGSALNNLAAAQGTLGRVGDARATAIAALAIRRELGDRRGIASTLITLATACLAAGDGVAAGAAAEEALAVERELGQGPTLVEALTLSARARSAVGDAAGADVALVEAAAVAKTEKDRAVIAVSSGEVAQRRGDLAEARRRYLEALDLGQGRIRKEAEAGLKSLEGAPKS
jgi:class 3 adenylate cyclase/tetratricopeptide (TPR) repeat protein